LFGAFRRRKTTTVMRINW